jgi:hypothetical protein
MEVSPGVEELELAGGHVGLELELERSKDLPSSDGRARE